MAARSFFKSGTPAQRSPSTQVDGQWTGSIGLNPTFSGSSCSAAFLSPPSARQCRWDQRRLEILADGLPLSEERSWQLTGVVFPLHCDESPHPRGQCGWCCFDGSQTTEGADEPGVGGPRRRARLVVLAREIGGRWSEETRKFLFIMHGQGCFFVGAETRRRCDGDVPSTHDVVNDFRHCHNCSVLDAQF